MTAPRHLLLLNYEYPPLGGGAANATLFFGRALHALGHRVTVITSGLRDEESQHEENGVTVFRLRTGRAAADRSTMREMMRYIRTAAWHAPRLARARRADATIAFFTIPSGPVALWLFARAKLPYVVSLRGSDVPGHDRSLDRMHALTRPLRRAVLRRAGAIVANSESLAATSRAADPFAVHVVPNGVDCELFHPGTKPRREAESAFKLLFVGRLHREKNLGVVLQQIARLAPRTRAQVELTVAGDGAQKSDLVALALEMGLARQIRWLGWQKKESLPELYRQADALVNPSLYEGMPNVVLEAMASGLPVLASDVPGNRSVVIPGNTGVCFALDRPAELATALTRFITEPNWATSLGDAARQRAEQHFSWTAAVKCYLELLPAPSANLPRP